MTPRNLYSHSDQTAQWQAANPNGPAGTGWAGRVADIMQFGNAGSILPAISVNGNALQLTGSSTRPLTVTPGARLGLAGLGDPTADQLRDSTMPQILTFDTGVSLIASAACDVLITYNLSVGEKGFLLWVPSLVSSLSLALSACGGSGRARDWTQ